MKYFFTSIFTTLIFICLLNVTAFSFEFNEVPLEDIDAFKENIIVSIHNEPIANEPFQCFDVDENGNVVIGVSQNQQKQILVYSSKGEYLYGLSFESYGPIGVGWFNGNVEIYFVRSEIAASYSQNAELLSIRQIESSFDNNEYWEKYVFSDKKIKNNKEYSMQNGNKLLTFLFDSKSLLIVDDGKVIYDATEKFYQQVIYNMIVSIIVLIVLFATFWKIIRQKKTGDGSLSSEEDNQGTVL